MCNNLEMSELQLDFQNVHYLLEIERMLYLNYVLYINTIEQIVIRYFQK